MTRIVINNVKDEFIPAFREFAEKMEANISDISAEDAESKEPYICDYGYSHEPNDETIRAIEECEKGGGGKVYASYDEFLKEIERELANEAKS